jgi:hypothetical protein
LAPHSVHTHITGNAPIQAGWKEVLLVELDLPTSSTDLFIHPGRYTFTGKEQFIYKLIVLWLLPHGRHLLSREMSSAATTAMIS